MNVWRKFLVVLRESRAMSFNWIRALAEGQGKKRPTSEIIKDLQHKTKDLETTNWAVKSHG